MASRADHLMELGCWGLMWVEVVLVGKIERLWALGSGGSGI